MVVDRLGRSKSTDGLRSTEAKEGSYRAPVEAGTDYEICLLDAAGIVTSWNEGARRFKGYEAAEIIGKHFSKFYTEEDRQAELPRRALEGAEREGRYENEGWRVRKDGSKFWANVVIDAIRDPHGKLIGFAKVTHELTQRKLAEETLHRSEEQFRILVQGVTDYAIYMLDPQGRITNWNPGAQRIKQYTPVEAVGSHFSIFYTEEDRAAGEPQRSLDIAIAEGRFEKEAIRVRKDGSRFWANVVIDPIRDADGILLGFAKITRDVTERKEVEAKLGEAREALFQSQKMEAIGQLTGGVAHDFNNLLTVILSSLDLLRRRINDDPKALRLLENAVQGAKRGASLTARMLAFGRRQSLLPRAVDVISLVRGMNELMKGSLGTSVSIETRFPLDLPPVLADSNQLELALLNLCTNARDAMHEGGTITISAYPKVVMDNQKAGFKAGSYICLAVADTGGGMDHSVLARAMEPFFTTKGVGKGTGLGLAMVHGMMEQSGGKLILSSSLGVGTTAELWFPQALEGLTPVADGPVEELVKEPSRMRPLAVLVVDDDPLVLVNTGVMLEDLGHTVVEALSGRAALDILAKGNSFDLIITDQVMPDMTGLQLAKIIRQTWSEMPIVLASGYADFVVEPALKLPLLPKPYLQRALAKALTDVLSSEQGARASDGR